MPCLALVWIVGYTLLWSSVGLCVTPLNLWVERNVFVSAHRCVLGADEDTRTAPRATWPLSLGL